METIYSLRDDKDVLRNMQEASRSIGPIELRETHGLVGSAAWWQCIADGELATHSVAGEISRVWLGQWEGGPAGFELQSTIGEISTWLCEVQPSLAKVAFRIGRRVVVKFVDQELKVAFNGSKATRVTLSISLD
jgi:hypothetical protein